MVRRSLPWFGTLLIVMGSLLLLRALGWVDVDWSVLLWAAVGFAGAVWSIGGFRSGRSGKVFWGTLLFLVALFQVLLSIPFLDLSAYYLTPAFTLACALAFLAAYISRPRSLPLLAGTLVFGSLAAGIWMAELGLLYRWEVASTVREYWPVALILFGVSLLVPGRIARNSS